MLTALTHKSRLLLILLAAAFGLMLVGTQPAEAYPRKALFEDFTSTTCGPCAVSAPEIEAALEMVGERVVAVAFHMSWPAPGNDPWYLANPADADGRRGVYGVNAIPWLVIDGTRFTLNRTRQLISQAIQTRLQTPSPVELRLDAVVINNELRVHITATSEQSFNGLKLQVCLTERFYQYRGPSGQNDHYDAMIMMVPDAVGTQFNINANQTLEWNLSRAMPQNYWHELEMDNLAVVAFVQAANQEVLQTENYILGYDSPAVTIQGWTLSDDDGDGRVEPGETAAITITVANAPNYLTAEQVNVTFTTQDAGIQIINREIRFNNLAGGASVNNANTPFRFRVANDFVPHPVTFRFDMTVQPNDIRSYQDIAFMVGWPPFLLVDVTNNFNASELMRGLFGRGEMPYADLWDRANAGIVSYDDILNYPAVLWYSFNNNVDIINDFEADALIDYLNHGGTLIIASPFLGAALGNHVLMSGYLAVSVANANTGVNYVRGLADDPDFGGARLFLGGGSGAGFPAARAAFNLRQGAQAVMEYHDAQGAERGIAAAKHEAGNYRTLTFGYPLESIGGVQGTDVLESFVARIWNWLQHTAAAPGEPAAPSAFLLDPAYPNPFNPNTTISFTLDRPGLVHLGLFDAAGREITTLLNNSVPAGRRSVTLDAGKLGLTNGIYYIRLDSQGRLQMQKALYLR